MVLILSTIDDQSTVDVIRWLHYLNNQDIQIIRLNDSDKLLIERVEIKEGGIEINLCTICNQTIALHKVTSYWYRRGLWRFCNPQTEMKGLNTALSNEIKSLENFINNFLNHLPKRIGSYHENFLSKLTCLMAAQSVGLKIPQTLITSFKQHLNTYLTASKAISDIMCVVNNDGNCIGLGTVQLDPVQMQNAPDSFFPTLFQHYIAKAYELRIFYLHERLWPMAIFSQKNEKTKIDFRNYDMEKPNRTVPYLLPSDIEEKLILLMNKLKLTSGSIDMAVDEDGGYHFFEVNPIGQFSQISIPCNYYLEREIATFLTSSI